MIVRFVLRCTRLFVASELGGARGVSYDWREFYNGLAVKFFA
jgi:hypothetical protein